MRKSSSPLNANFTGTGLFLTAIVLLVTFNLSAQNFTHKTLPQVSDTRDLTIGDFNNDNRLDIFFSNINNANSELYLNLQDTLMQETTGLGAINTKMNATALGDYDNDCFPDLIASNGGGGIAGGVTQNQLFRNLGNGNFNSVTTIIGTPLEFSTEPNWGDYDNDGDLDLFISNTNLEANRLYTNNGNGSFTEVTGQSLLTNMKHSQGATWVDFDNDGDLDIFVFNASNENNELYRQDSSGYFTEITVGAIVNDGGTSHDATWGDYNDDGFPDLFVCNTSNQNNFLYKNLGNGTFQKISTGTIVSDMGYSIGARWADFDNDGDLDLVVANGTTLSGAVDENFYYRNNGNETFSKLSISPLTSDRKSTRAVDIGDLNKDGFIDIIGGSRDESNDIYYNQGNGNNFININLVGNTSNKMAFGAKIRLKASLNSSGTSSWQYRELMCKGGGDQAGSEVHFGLKSAVTIDSLIINWPSGNQCVFTNIAANSFYNLGEANCSLDTATNALFTYSSLFLNTQFTNQSSGSISNYAWDFGDGSTSTLTNPKHRYNAPGKYLVTLTAFDGYCKHSVYADSIEVCPDTSSATFTYTQNGTSLVFSDASNMLAHSYAWTINGASVSSGNSFNYTYTQSGQINVCLTVTDSCYSKSYCETIPLCLDTLDASFSSNTNLFTTNFNTASSNSNLTSLWDFGDGNTLLVQNGSPIQHTYNQPGTYYVCHTISDSCNAFLYCDSVDVCLDPVAANFSFSLNGSVVQFTNLSTGANTYSWDFGDGNQSSGTDPINLFASNGTYTVCLIAENDCTSDTLCIPITVCPGQGTASYTQVKMPNIPLGIQFTSTSTNATSHMWTFGDGSSSVNANPLKIYAAPGNYNVCLAITDSCGDTDTLCKLINPETISLDENNVLSQVQIYPNPARNHVYIKQSGSEKIQLRLYDLKGKLITEKLFNTDGFNLNLEHLHNGVYVLELKQGIAIRREKLLKY